MLDPDVVFDKLAGFQTANELADYLKSENCQGYMQIETLCPIARYFYQHTSMPLVNVGEFVSISQYDQVDEWQKECTETMKEFIQEFDNYTYPALVLCTEDEYCPCRGCREYLY